MKIFIDNNLLQDMIFRGIDNSLASLYSCLQLEEIQTKKPDIHLILSWPTLFKYLELDFLFNNFIKFDDQAPLFQFITSLLVTDLNQDLLIRLYDQIFVECLTHVKNLSEIDPNFLISRIQAKKVDPISLQARELIFPLLNHYEKYITENPSHALHDLVLYLAWDRVCVNIAVIFEYNSRDTTMRKGLNVLKECILESFQHITNQNKTTPSFFRLIEALYEDEMREENLQVHSDEEWLILCQGVRALKPRESVADIFYIDGALRDVAHQKSRELNSEIIEMVTLESTENIQSALALVDSLSKKIKLIVPNWPYSLKPLKIICLTNWESTYQITTIINR